MENLAGRTPNVKQALCPPRRETTSVGPVGPLGYGLPGDVSPNSELATDSCKVIWAGRFTCALTVLQQHEISCLSMMLTCLCMPTVCHYMALHDAACQRAWLLCVQFLCILGK